MLRFLILLSFTVFLVSCKKENNTPEQPVDEMAPPGMEIVKGTFTSTPGHNVSGTAKIFEDNGRKELRLENFSSTNGPDLRVYLSKDLSASSFISLGSLKSVSGNQNYVITGMPDFTEFKHVLIWCEQFTVLFGSATIN